MSAAKREPYQRIMLLEVCGSEFITSWKKRFEAERLAGLYARHRGRIVSDKVMSQEAKILSATQQAPADGSTHWTTRKLARPPGRFAQPGSVAFGPGLESNPTG